MLYVKNAHFQAVQPVKPILKNTISTEFTNVTKNISSKINLYYEKTYSAKIKQK